MHFSTRLSFGLVIAGTLIDANTVPNGVVKLDARHKHFRRSINHKTKRDSSVLADLTLNDQWILEGGYFIDVEVGTPPQKFELLVDTGSSNFYLPSTEAKTCQEYLCPGGACMLSSSCPLTRLIC